MKVSLNWLKEYVDIKEDPQEVALKLTMHSAEVEEVIPQAELLENVVVGKIKTIREHPDADKLKLVDTEIDEGVVQIVCGGTNLKEGLLVAVAKPGAKVRWHGEGEPVVLEEAKIRGEKSYGMICLDSEIGLGDNVGTEIMELDQGQPGQPLAEVLGLDDQILDIDNKSLTHRSDLFGHLGLAREYAALTGQKLKAPKLSKPKGKNSHPLTIKVEEPELCPRYQAIVLDKITIKDSPDWMQARLTAAGMRPINNLVDITNYVMLEYAQPLHAFDYDKIGDQTIIVRRAQAGEEMTTLDQKKHKLEKKDLLICDSQQPIALAGVMGGADSEVTESTKTIALESANFNKTSIRKTARRLGMHSEASMRFERGPGISLTENALYRAVELFQKYAGAEISSPVYDVVNSKLQTKQVELKLDYLRQLSGVNIEMKQASDILESLELKTKYRWKSLSVEIPLFRPDLNYPEDLVEEITRVYGYDRIRPKALSGKLAPVEPLPEIYWGDYLTMLLSGWGFSETMNYSFYGYKELTNCQLKEEDHLSLANSLSQDLKYLRIGLVPGLLKNVKLNLDQNYHNLRLFEIGHIYYPPQQELKILSALLTGPKKDIFFKAKGVLTELFAQMHLDFEIKVINPEEKDFRTRYSLYDVASYCQIFVEQKNIGSLSLIAQEILDNHGIKEQVAYFYLELEALSLLAITKVNYQPLPKFPPVTIDLSIKIDPQYSWQEIKETILKTNKLITKVELFDIYEDSKAMHLVFQDPAQTLTMASVEKFREEIMQQLNKKFNATIRDK